jgi:hypothetical protein
MEPVEKKAAKQRQIEGGARGGKASARGANSLSKVSASSRKLAVDKIGAFAGISGRQVEKIATATGAQQSIKRLSAVRGSAPKLSPS